MHNFTKRVTWLRAVAASVFLAVAFAGCGDGISQEDVDKAISQAQRQETIKDLRQKLKKPRHDVTVHGAPNSSSGSPPVGEDCGDGVRAGANTSCPFSLYVAEGYRAEGPGVVRAYSPATDETYAMTCETGEPAVCRGGNNASVYIYG